MNRGLSRLGASMRPFQYEGFLLSSRAKPVRARHLALALGGLIALPSCDPAPTRPVTPVGAIEVVAGDNQVGKAGVELERPLVVRVTDQDGDPLAGVGVEWRVGSGSGRFRASPYDAWGGSDRAVKVTLADGRAMAFLTPTAYAPSVVTASVIDHPGIPPVTFDADVSALVIRIEDNWGWAQCSALCFSAPGAGATIPLGGTVEWSNVSSVGDVELRSTATPTGGTAIDGLVPTLGTWRTILDAEGVWAYETVNLAPHHHSTASLIVR